MLTAFIHFFSCRFTYTDRDVNVKKIEKICTKGIEWVSWRCRGDTIKIKLLNWDFISHLYIYGWSSATKHTFDENKKKRIEKLRESNVDI